MENFTDPSPVSILGTGAIGTAAARILLRAGQPVVVWNRTRQRTAELAAAGAGVADSAAAALAAAPLSLLTLTDHRAVAAVLDQATGELPGRTVITLTTGSPEDARRTADRVANLGADYLDAGLQTSPEDLGTAAATILYSGLEDAFARHRATLARLSTPRYVGPSPDAAAVWDLALFGVWYDAQLGLLRALDTARAYGIELTEFTETAAAQLRHVVDGAPTTAAEVATRDYPRGPATLAEHLPVLDQLGELRTGNRLADGGLGQAAERIRQLIGAGHGQDGLSALLRVS
ncbi:NAD(P)-binding domain-containing protein [Microlunatus parietis]|uniref:3-hydroxyisobutyrate dehydrogenase-like beta-hydroxyacid dehydrogenase n=1 Tax=Microlunatus parietis TaxID=682979 RepID=A0A7Y9L903_9ACTN|nr:NAD(P)-binding domain-containing protein [Microlunatus parietis]NYE69047.1 3-hydroxyisobutyrate dehydrogenase-like beta-hydroxyacid dehydrogenase [Microlunatus parietis]